MKKLLLLVLGFVMFKTGYAQYPIQQFIGADSAIVTSKGGMQGRFVNVVFTDTSQANTQRIRQYPGAMIYAAGKMWVRNTTATGWTELAYGPISTTNIYNSDGTLTGNRELDGNSNNLTFTAVKKFEFSGDSLYYLLDPAGNLRLKLGNQQFTMQSDTASLATRISYTGNLGSSFTKHSIVDKNYVDSVASVASGTVTSVATNNGTGITGGTITTTGTLAIDTALISTRAWRQKGIDSVTSLITARPTGSGTTNYVSKWTGTSALGNSQLTDASNTLTYEASLGNAAFNIKSPSGYYYPSINLFSNNTLAATVLGYNGRLYLTAAGNAGIWFGNSSGTQMLLTNSGRLLIGTTTESTYELDVVGDIRSTLDANINGLTVGKGGGSVATNTAVGVQAINATATGIRNTAIGANALPSVTSGNANTAIGQQALEFLTTGSQNVAVGRASLNSATGSDNTAVGWHSFLGLTTGIGNTAVGSTTGGGITTGNYNTIIGANVTGLSSSLSNTIILADGQGNRMFNVSSAIGVNIGSNAGISYTTGSGVAIGPDAGRRQTTASENTIIGSNAGAYLTTNNSNTLIGFYAGNVVSGAGNTYLGWYAGVSAGASNYNTGIGTGSLQNITTGSNNTAIGYRAGRFYGAATSGNTTGANGIFIGYQSRASADGNTNETVIGYDALGNGSNSVTLGNSSVTKTILQGNVLIGTTTDAGYKLQISGTTQTTALRIVNGDVICDNTYISNAFVLGGSTNLWFYNNSSKQIRSNGTDITVFTTVPQLNTQSTFVINDAGSAPSGYKIQKWMTGSVEKAYLEKDGNLAVLTSGLFGSIGSINTSAVLEATSTTKGFLPPRMTNAQMVAIATPAAGLVVYDTTNNKLNVYDGTNWVTLH